MQAAAFRKQPLAPSEGETFVQADIADMAAALAISKGIDAIVHLGGYAGEGPWETILKANIIGCYNMFEAARRNGVKRLVFASSNHVPGFYRCDQKIDHRVYPKPDTRSLASPTISVRGYPFRAPLA